MIKKDRIIKLKKDKEYNTKLKKLLYFMKENYITQTDIANEIGCSRQNIFSALKEFKGLSVKSVEILKSSKDDVFRQIGFMFEELNMTRNEVFWK